LKAVLIILCSMLLAWLSYRFVERPIIAYRHRLRQKQESEAAAAVQVGPAGA
jgi:peptidoglycan/LPS O-acetylase OafA/YrhL